MKYIVRKIFTGFVSMVVIFSQFVTAADVANFVIQLNPTSPKMGEATDMTIKAVDANGTVVKDYKGLVMMDFDGYQDTSSYEMPSNGYYQFTEADQGEKLFSK